MKIPTLLLSLSLVGNAALAVVLMTKTEGSRVSTGLNPHDSAAVDHTSDTHSSSTTSAQRSAPAHDGLMWNRLYSHDRVTLATRLRAAGFPNGAVRAVLDAYLAEDFQAKSAVFARDQIPTEYWKSETLARQTRARAHAETSETLYREQIALERRIFGSSIDVDDPETLARARRRFGNLPEAKIAELQNTNEEYMLKQMELAKAHTSGKGGEITAEGHKMLAQLQVDMEQKIKSLLTAEEYADYELHASTTATSLRMQMESFRPTEQEYRTIFALQRSLDAQFAGKPFTDDMRDAYRAARSELDKQVEAALGPDRFADYVEARQHGSDKLSRLLARLDLPLRTARTIDQLRSDVSERANAIRQNTQLTSDQKAAQLSALAGEAKTTLTKTLEERGYEAYDDLKGEWIRALERSPASAKP